ncbi:MAG: hypothetical protein PSX36_05585 [bacterium]|nr:hypothetical protein [bacterium]
MRTFFVILLQSVLLFSCAKKKSNGSDPAAQIPQQTAPEIFVKVDGNTFSCNICSSTYLSGGLRGVTFATSSSSDQILLRFSTLPVTGTYSLVKQGNPAVTYVKNFTYYHAVMGSLTITAIDTSANGSINQLSATFQCKTDTSFIPSYALSEGSIHLNYK